RACDAQGAHCGPFTSGDGTTLDGLTLVDGTGVIAVLVANRTRGLSIRQVKVEAAGGDGITLQFTSGIVEQSMVTGAFHAMQAGPGNDRSPSRVVASHNRFVANDPAGLNFYSTDSVDWLLQYNGHPTLELDAACSSGPGNFFCPDVPTTDCAIEVGSSMSALV